MKNIRVNTVDRMRVKFFSLIVILPLAAGAFIYLLSHDTILLQFHFKVSNFNIPKIIQNYLPDFLWSFAFFNSLFIIWKENRKMANLYSCASLLVSFSLEFLQKVGYINGTFDLNDVFVYFLGYIFSYNCIKNLTI